MTIRATDGRPVDSRSLRVDRRQNVSDDLQQLTKRIETIETEMRANTGITREVRDLMELGRSGLRVLGWVGTAVKWFGGIAAAIAAIYAAWHAIINGGPPK